MSLITAIRQPLEAGAPSGVPTESDLARINARASKPFTAADVYVFPGLMCNHEYRKDGPFRFGLSSLKAFQKEADEGIPYNIQHDWDTPFIGGYTYASYLDAETNDLRGAIFLARGVVIDPDRGWTSDQEIEAIEKGLRRSLSIGATSGRWVCDLCGENVWGSKCPHLPGVETDEGGEATVTIEDSSAIHIAGCDTGALPRTFILQASAKAQHLASAGVLTAKAYTGWRDRFQVAGAAVISPPTQTQPNPGKEEKPMREKLAAALAALGLTTLATACMGAKEEDLQDLAAKLSAEVKNEVEAKIAVHPLIKACHEAEIETPESLAETLKAAKTGRELESGVRATAKALAVSALGAEEGAKWAASCDELSLVALKPIADSWQAQVDAKSGGTRVSVAAAAAALSAEGGTAETVADRMAARVRKAAGANGKGGN